MWALHSLCRIQSVYRCKVTPANTVHCHQQMLSNFKEKYQPRWELLLILCWQIFEQTINELSKARRWLLIHLGNFPKHLTVYLVDLQKPKTFSALSADPGDLQKSICHKNYFGKINVPITKTLDIGLCKNP